jgi:hypothetical protein
MDGLFMTGNMRFSLLAIALFFIIGMAIFTTLLYVNKQKSADSAV